MASSARRRRTIPVIRAHSQHPAQAHASRSLAHVPTTAADAPARSHHAQCTPSHDNPRKSVPKSLAQAPVLRHPAHVFHDRQRVLQAPTLSRSQLPPHGSASFEGWRWCASHEARRAWAFHHCQCAYSRHRCASRRHRLYVRSPPVQRRTRTRGHGHRRTAATAGCTTATGARVRAPITTTALRVYAGPRCGGAYEAGGSVRATTDALSYVLKYQIYISFSKLAIFERRRAPDERHDGGQPDKRGGANGRDKPSVPRDAGNERPGRGLVPRRVLML